MNTTTKPTNLSDTRSIIKIIQDIMDNHIVARKLVRDWSVDLDAVGNPNLVAVNKKLTAYCEELRKLIDDTYSGQKLLETTLIFTDMLFYCQERYDNQHTEEV